MLVGWRPSLVGWRTSLVYRLEAVASRLEAHYRYQYLLQSHGPWMVWKSFFGFLDALRPEFQLQFGALVLESSDGSRNKR